MKFKVGDRVRVISINDTGTIETVEYSGSVGAVTVWLDTPEKLMPKERERLKNKSIRGYELAKAAEKLTAKYYTFTMDIELLLGRDTRPDWASIWDDNSN